MSAVVVWIRRNQLGRDGRGSNARRISAWHKGEITSGVYLERITVEGCAFDGLVVDVQSRNITQAG